jgi:formate hydrogenlyase transcriptional activator
MGSDPMADAQKHTLSTVVLPLASAERSTEERYEALLRFSRNISGSRDLQEAMRLIAWELSSVLDFDYASLFLNDEPGKITSCYELKPNGQSILVPSPASMPEHGLASWVFDHQHTWIPGGKIHFRQAAEFLSQRGLNSACAVPLTTTHRRLGSMVVAGKHASGDPEAETRFILHVGSHVAVAIDNALELEASEIRRKEAERSCARRKLILDVNNSIASNLDLHDLLRSISASVRSALRCDGAGVSVLDRESNQLRLYALDFPESKGFAREGILTPLDGTMLGEAFKTGKPAVNVTDLDGKDSRGDRAHAEGIRLACVVPLFNRDRKLGVLTVGRRDEEPFRQDDVDLLAEVAGQVAIALDNAKAYRQINDLKDQLAKEKLYLEDEIRSERNFEEIVGHSAALRRVLKQIETVAPTDSTVLIYGETGSGKELVARAIHDLSSRGGNTFVKLNCAAIPTGLLESEMFGHERGAFTGAVAQRIGRFEVANRGTIFLDEIGEIPLELQPKLLRVLQEREFERLGSSRTQRTDARLIAATNRDLAAMAEEQKFRTDLYYRLNVFPVHVPALRERPEDIPLLVRHFVQHFARQMNKAVDTIPAESMNAMARYEWPGNIRELQNLIERAMILSAGPVLRVPLNDLKSHSAAPAAGAGKHQTLEDAERAHILATLKETKWVVSGPGGAATRLGMNRSTLQFHMKKLGIVRPG